MIYREGLQVKQDGTTIRHVAHTAMQTYAPGAQNIRHLSSLKSSDGRNRLDEQSTISVGIPFWRAPLFRMAGRLAGP
jgi:hypothetical protein